MSRRAYTPVKNKSDWPDRMFTRAGRHYLIPNDAHADPVLVSADTERQLTDVALTLAAHACRHNADDDERDVRTLTGIMRRLVRDGEVADAMDSEALHALGAELAGSLRRVGDAFSPTVKRQINAAFEEVFGGLSLVFQDATPDPPLDAAPEARAEKDIDNMTGVLRRLAIGGEATTAIAICSQIRAALRRVHHARNTREIIDEAFARALGGALIAVKI